MTEFPFKYLLGAILIYVAIRLQGVYIDNIFFLILGLIGCFFFGWHTSEYATLKENQRIALEYKKRTYK